MSTWRFAVFTGACVVRQFHLVSHDTDDGSTIGGSCLVTDVVPQGRPRSMMVEPKVMSGVASVCRLPVDVRLADYDVS
jgi:hypothetical protein